MVPKSTIKTCIQHFNLNAFKSFKSFNTQLNSFSNAKTAQITSKIQHNVNYNLSIKTWNIQPFHLQQPLQSLQSSSPLQSLLLTYLTKEHPLTKNNGPLCRNVDLNFISKHFSKIKIDNCELKVKIEVMTVLHNCFYIHYSQFTSIADTLTKALVEYNKTIHQ